MLHNMIKPILPRILWVKQCNKPSPKSPNEIGGMFTIPKWVIYHCFTHIDDNDSGDNR